MSTLRYSAPVLGVEVTRLSDKSVLISRVNRLSFSKAPENLPYNACWKLIAGDTATLLRTRTCQCPPADKPRPCEEKKRATKQKETKTAPTSGDKNKPLDLGADLDYTVSATVAKMPSHAVLLAPNATAYRIDIPDPTDKKNDKPKPIEMKQGDST